VLKQKYPQTGASTYDAPGDFEVLYKRLDAMEIVVKKSDFVLTPYMKSNHLWATYQVLKTVIPYILLWLLAVRSASTSLWLIPPIIVLITLFSLRCFSLMRDCGHYSLFSSKRVNRFVGFALGLINAMPQYAWSRDHAYREND
jgi:omega-6 fatty acid desaturase (delta-12 desaturase)